jgi:hypothetical protein
MPNGEVAPETIDEEFGSTSDDEWEIDEDAWEKWASQRLSPEFLSQFPGIEAQVETWDNAVTDELDAELTFDNLETDYAPPPEEVVPAHDQTYQEIKGTTDAQKDAVARQGRAARSKMRQRAALILLGVTIVEALLVYLVKVGQSNPSPSGDFKQADADAAKAMLDNWRGQPDPAFWAGVADYVEQAHASLQSQMVMMGYIKNWVAADPITWGPTEKSDDILALTRAVTPPGHAGDMYRRVAGMQHNGAPLQRAVAADLCEHALAQLIAQGQPSSSS